jgi:hypothetical protein
MPLYIRIVLGLALFLVTAGIIYWVTSYELVGAPLLLVAAGCFAFIGTYLRRAVRATAEQAGAVSEEETEPHVAPTIWPFVFSLAGVGIALGVIINMWLLVPGAILFIAAAIGWFIDIGGQWRHRQDTFDARQ